MDLWSAAILGIVEGLTEFIPVSSTAHLDFAAKLMALPQTEFLKTFEIAIQVGAILAILFVAGKKLLGNRRVFSRVAAAFIPTAIIGLALYKVVKGFLLGNALVAILALGVGGVLILLLERRFAKRGAPAIPDDPAAEIARMPVSRAVAIGCAQAIAVIPGVSRSGATIMAGLGLGMSRPAIAEFSFLLAVPTIAAAAGYDILKSAPTLGSVDAWPLAVGFVTAFASALLAVRWLLRYVSRSDFKAFGWYRIAAALVLAWALL